MQDELSACIKTQYEKWNLWAMQSNLIELKTENKELILILLMNIRILEGGK